MDTSWTHRDSDQEPLALPEFRRNLVEAEAATMLVREGVARTMTLSGLRYAGDVAALILPAAQREGIAVRVERSETGAPILVVGPCLQTS
jgi:hypothetical protein